MGVSEGERLIFEVPSSGVTLMQRLCAHILVFYNTEKERHVLTRNPWRAHLAYMQRWIIDELKFRHQKQDRHGPRQSIYYCKTKSASPPSFSHHSDSWSCCKD